ncbi:MAG: beta-aspartyl-peptidase [Defluviitaleaceae bacterium]|nr:beta-aspartyl-peptidase [Defluviitaleaceae bacterium]
MLTLIKGANVYAPEKLGKKDVLLAGGKIERIDDNIDIASGSVNIDIINGDTMTVIPGIIDQHVHIIGGGGENGFSSRTPEVTLSNITRWGITTVVGVLGTDATSRHMESLLAKAMGLNEEGLSTYIYTGSYEIPLVTLTGSVRRDIMLIDKIVGVGEVAISDHRSSAPSIDDIEYIAAEARVAGILSRKAGVTHIHLGPGKTGFKMINEIVERSDIPIFHFRPTHVNRNTVLLDEAMDFAKRGGMIDITASSNPNRKSDGFSPAQAVKYLIDNGTPVENITLSSDGNGSLPAFDKDGNIIGLVAASLSSMYYQLKSMVYDENIPLEMALKVMTSNPADGLKLYGKGYVAEGMDADITILDRDFGIKYVFANGRRMVDDGKIVVKGTFEEF